ncbi:hypothetical protein ACEQ8H_002232 [Pleosporales sp. CAS-2024a]
MAEGIKARIAALNLEEVHAPAPGSRPAYSYEAVAAKKKAPPPPPPPAQRQRQQQQTNQPGAVPRPRPSPALPPRPPPRSSSTTTTTTTNAAPRPTPALPPRRPFDRPSLNRRESTDSISTVASEISTFSLASGKTGTSNGNGTLYQVRAPAYDPSKLPPLPPKRASDEKSAIRSAMASKRDHLPSHALPPSLSKSPELPARPSPERPPLPGRPTTNTANATRTNRVIAPPPRKSALELGFSTKATEPPPLPENRPAFDSGSGTSAGAPPPVPLSSRPNLDAIMASKPKPGAVGSCLVCRDFSGPDQHAARYPREHLPSSDVGWLAHQLCSPFPSHTDKARAIFTWLHHNVDYDVHSFFNGTVSPTTPEKTMTSGLAVCEGYAGLFAALALKAGLQALVVSGDGKGFGHRPLEPGQPVPAFSSNHAWNAVCIDNGEWKLVDPCWGAGHIGCANKNEGYVRKFNPSQFTMSNDEFGTKHFPSDNSHQFRNDGRVLTYEEFKRDDMGGRVQVMSGCSTEHGVAEQSIYPQQLTIKIRAPAEPSTIRFQFSTMCAHWDHQRHGQGLPYVMLLSVAGRDGRNTQYLPFHTDGKTWWLDVERLELGAPGQKISVNAVTEFCGKSGRGLSYQTWNNKKAYSCQFGVLCMWELA